MPRIVPLLLALSLLVLIVASVWPRGDPPTLHPDSIGYLWKIPQRLPAYPLALSWIGNSATLGYVQAGLSLTSFCLLGWLLAAYPGAIVGGLVAASEAIATWNESVLSESFTCTGIALTASVALFLSRTPLERKTIGPLGAILAGRGESSSPPVALSLLWVALVVYVSLLRDTNVVILAPLALPFGRFGRGWLIAAIILLAAILVGNTWTANRHGRWILNYYSAVVQHIGMDPEAHQQFRDAGMPPLRQGIANAALWRWLEEEGGRRMYERWVITRPASYVEPLPHLRGHRAPANFTERYGGDRPPPGIISRIGTWVWLALGPPLWIGLLVCLVPLAELRIGRPISLLAGMAVLLLPAAYLASFAGYHAAGIETIRHTLAAGLGYRLAFAFGLAALVGQGRWHGATQRGRS